MKKFLLLTLSSLFFISCSVKFNRALLKPTEVKLPSKIPNLLLQNEYVNVTTIFNPESTSNKIKSLIEEDFEENILSNEENLRGYIIPELNANVRVAGFGWAFLTGFTLFVPNLFGMPYGAIDISLDSEFTITDSNGRKVWRKSYFRNNRVNVGLYYNSINENCADNETLLLVRSILDELKSDLERDRLEISGSLEKAKAVPSQNNTAKDWQSNGTGFFISSSGYIATNNHVIDGASKIEVEFNYKNGIKSFNASVVKVDATNDLAIIKIDDPSFIETANIPYNFSTNRVDVGTDVFALGYPMALSLMGKDIKFTDGKISSKTGFNGDITTYQIQVPIQPGNSGGPLFDFSGNLVGITSSGVNRQLDLTENVNYAIKSAYLLNLVDALPNTLKLPASKELENKSITEQIKKLSDFVVIIKVK